MSITPKPQDFIVPREVIDSKYVGGWTQCLADHKNLSNEIVRYDQYLFCIEIRTQIELEKLMTTWVNMGFESTAEMRSHTYWSEFCVYDSEMGGITLLCKWLKRNEDGTLSHRVEWKSSFIKRTQMRQDLIRSLPKREGFIRTSKFSGMPLPFVGSSEEDT